jgi:hypothetical protein
MQEKNLHGRGQHRVKSINLEANILSEWTGSSTVLHQQIRVRVVALLASVAVAGVGLPSLRMAAISAEARAKIAAARNSVDAQAVSTLDQRSKAAEPFVQQSQRLKESRANLSALLGNVALVIDAVPTSVAFESVQVEVMDAQLTITCKSQAETSDAGQAFVAAASLGPNVAYAVQASTMKSETLGKDGVAFDFIKRVNLQP